tara:strand:- start:94 stop:477 length:384 start_codon:yes stop_codon:yes gene_type:complete
MTKQEYQKQIEDRVYNLNDYLTVLKDVMEDIVTQTVHMDDRELEYDRGKFIGMTEPMLDKDSDGYYDYKRDIHTISTEVTQLVKKGRILYSRLGDVEERRGHKIRKDFFTDRDDYKDDDEDLPSKYK